MTATNPRLDPPGGNAVLAGRPVARVGFGAMQLPGRRRSTALAVLRRAIELGINHIDTAQYYGPDVANELIHAALYPYPDELVLVSKVGVDRDARGGWIPAQRPEQLRAGVEANLRSLAVERFKFTITAPRSGASRPTAKALPAISTMTPNPDRTAWKRRPWIAPQYDFSDGWRKNPPASPMKR